MLPVRHIRAVLTTSLDGMVCIVSFEIIGEFQREKLYHKPQCLAEMDVCVDVSYE